MACGPETSLWSISTKSTLGPRRCFRSRQPAGYSGVVPMHMLGSVSLLLPGFLCLGRSIAYGRSMLFVWVEGMPSGFTSGAGYCRRSHSTVDFSPGGGFRPAPSAPWVPFVGTPPAPAPESIRARGDRFGSLISAPERPSPCRPRAARAFPPHRQ